TENAEFLKDDKLEPSISELKDHTFIRSTGEQDDARPPYAEAGFLDILEVRDIARREHYRIEILLQKQPEAASLLRQAVSLEQEDQLEKALELVQKVIIELPQNTEAITYSRRIHKMLSDRAKADAQDAIEKLEQLINENREHLEGEDYFGPNDLKASILLAAMSARSNDLDATISDRSTEERDEILRLRDKAKAEKERLETIIASKKSILARLQEARN